MPVNLHIPSPEDVLPVAGVTLGVTMAGIRKADRRDLTVIQVAEGTTVSGVFTRNRFCAAPVQVCREHLGSQTPIRALVINTGCANAGTGEAGLRDARQTCEELAQRLGVSPQAVLPFSTGVILELLPMNRLIAGLDAAIAAASPHAWLDAAYGIMTTDTQPKVSSRQLRIDGRTITMTGISKGAGMIRPNMATMLGFIATDAGIAQPLLDALVRELADHSFNRITVDGDTSTNDSFMVMATGSSGLQVDHAEDAGYSELRQALIEISRDLACKIVRDAEGATKFMTIVVQGGRSTEECLQVAYAIGHSPLVKTAFYASDPNLGRILAAIGYAGIADLNVDGVTLWLDDVRVAVNGGRDPAYLEAEGQRIMQQAEITIRVDLGRGNVSDTIYTCDFSHDYVSINADYRS